jgi:NADH dehydrogenase
MTTDIPTTAGPRVVIVGGGFGGLTAARTLKRSPVDVTVLDRTNHYLFQPLLYQVATGVLSPADIAMPLRVLLRNQPKATVLLAEVEAIDLARRVVTADAGRLQLPFDFLIVATGSRHSYFSHPEWEAMAPGLKTLDDAREIRRRFLMALEEAEKNGDADGLLTFVIIGGGPTGVELAGMLPTLAREGFKRDFRRLDPSKIRIVLIEGGPRLLAAFPESLSARAYRDLEELGVECRTGAIVTQVTDEAVYIGSERIATRTVLWAAGNAASPLVRAMGVPVDRAGRAEVSSDLSVPGHPNVFVVGDAAAVEGAPGLAAAANQMGAHAARMIARTLDGQPRETFRYRDKGSMAVIGRGRAVVDFGRIQLTGVLAFNSWLLLHLLYLAGFRNRLSVLIEWGYSYFTYRPSARLITRDDAHAVSAPHAPPPP